MGNRVCTDGGETSPSFIMSLWCNLRNFEWETGRARMGEKLFFYLKQKFYAFWMGNRACTDGGEIPFSFIMSIRYNLTNFKWETGHARMGGENYSLFRIKIWHIFMGNGTCTDGREICFSFIMSLRYNLTNFKWETGRAWMGEKIIFRSESKCDIFLWETGHARMKGKFLFHS